MRVKFDPVEDRMQVGLHAPDGSVRTYWVTRRQWLGLLDRLLALDDLPQDPQSLEASQKQAAASMAATSGADQGKVDGEKPPQHGGALTDSALVQSIALRAVRVRRLTDGVQIAFVPTKRPHAIQPVPASSEQQLHARVLSVPQARVPQFMERLKTKAESAGWDVEAGLKRLQVGRLASAALMKAKSGAGEPGPVE